MTIFRAEGADNVRWVWCPNASAFNDGTAQTFYPGDDFVDWTCADGYNWAPGRPGDDYRSFQDIFAGFYGWARLQKKPIMVGEFGVQERNPGEKAEWILAARDAVKSDFPLMRAVVYFERCVQWNPTTSFDARLRVARIYDRHLNDKARAGEWYRAVLTHETEERRRQEAQRRLGELNPVAER